MSAAPGQMRLEVLTPTALVVDEPIVKLVADGPDGLFALLPRHIDMAAALVPGLLAFVTVGGEERFLGIDEGVLVKRGAAVRISVLDAIASADLASLRAEVARRFLGLDEQERAARTALARLEAGAIRHLLEIGR